MRESTRDLAALVVPQAGRVVSTDDPWEPYRLVDVDGVVVESVATYLRDLQAAGRSATTARSYCLDLLRWFRFLWAIDMCWDRATRVEARDFCRWLQVAGQPVRPHWRHQGEPGTTTSGRPGGTHRPYAASVRAHSETVLRSFYDFHLEAGTGPILNPFPLDRARRGRRAHAHRNPMDPHRNERTGLYRPTVPSRVPRSVPDEEFNEIFARLPSHRDRALVAFYVSTGARASELLSTTQGGVDPGRGLITVVRKGSREIQELPASTDAFVWLRLYQVEMAQQIPRGRTRPLWWTRRRPARPLTYHAVHRMFERVNAHVGTSATLHSLRHTAAYRMAEDPGLPLTDVQFVLGHAALTTTQLYLTQGRRGPPGAGPSQRADPAGRRASAPCRCARLPARVVGRAVWEPAVVITDVERDTDVPDHRSPAPPVVPTLISARFPGRPRAAGWPAPRQDREQVFDRLTRAPFLLDSAGAQKERRRGLVALLDWLGAQPGASWQDRWLASGADPAGADWRRIPAQWLRATGRTEGLTGPLGAALTVAVCADVLRPSIAWFVRAVPRGGALARGMAQTRDTAGFARLRQVCDLDRHLPAAAGRHTLHRAAVGLGAHGGMIADITVGDVLELLDAESAAHRKPMAHGVAFYRALHQSGILGPDAPARLEELRSTGQRTPAELIDRFALACQPIRDLLVDYLAERHPRLDYSSLRSLAADLGNVFWKDLERHHPGINSLHLTPEVAAAWKQRLRTRQKTTTTATGEKTAITVDRIGYRQCLTPVRAFYLDLAQWALEDPAHWGQWVAPCPIGEEEINQRKAARHRKSRMDARTRQRLPVLPVLVRAVDERRKTTEALLLAARRASPGECFTVAEQTLTRAVTKNPTGRVWIDDPATGKRRDLAMEEDLAFWAWATVEVLRTTGVRIEELLEITHHSLVQYRLPSTGELIPLLQITPSKTDSERLLVVSPELADVLSAIISRVRGGTTAVPIIPAYDRTECVWLAPAPWLFQRRLGTEHRRICSGAIRNMLNAALAHSPLTDPTTGGPLRFTPHDFRRIFITDAIMSGLPPHIAQIIAGHQDINVTLGYKAVYPEEAIQAHLAFLARRRALPPSEEYRVPTDEEWTEFLGHFERRKVSTGTCGRAFGAACIHEHACIRCSMLWPDPTQHDRLTEIRDNLTARIAEAEREGWLGEVEGLKISLAGAEDKLAQIRRRTRNQNAVELGIPTHTSNR